MSSILITDERTLEPAPKGLKVAEHRPYAAHPLTEEADLRSAEELAATKEDARADFISGLRQAARMLPPEDRQTAYNESPNSADAFMPQAEFEATLHSLFDNGAPIDINELLDKLELRELEAIQSFDYELTGLDETPIKQNKWTNKLIRQGVQFRAELYRQKLLRLLWKQEKAYEQVRGQLAETLGLEDLNHLIEKLNIVPVREGRQSLLDDPRQQALDPTISSNPANTLLKAALLALRHQEMRRLESADTQELQAQTRRFVLGALNPHKEVKIYDISDVYGAEAGLPASAALNDATRIRIDIHWEELEERYGVKVKYFNQGASINCPEQCGAAALAAANQARRADPLKKIRPRFFMLNNASRTKDADGSDGGTEASQSSALLYFNFDLGDGVLHSGVAYGHQTLTLLKPYIKELYEVGQTEKGSQYRSLEIQKHVGAWTAFTSGAAPAALPLKPLDIEESIPSLELAENEALYLGSDKYLNGVTSRDAGDFLGQFLDDGENSAQVSVTVLDREGNAIVNAENYTLAKSLGAIRDGGKALWESSTPSASDPKAGKLSVGIFKEERGDINQTLLQIPEGAVIRVERLAA